MGGNRNKFDDPTSMDLRRTLAQRFIPLADKLRNMVTRFGLRPYKLSLVRVKWSGGERGVGTPFVQERTPILPTPRIADLSGLTEIVQPVGVDEVGGIMVTEVSGRYTEDQLRGFDESGVQIPYDEEFFYEIEYPQVSGYVIRRRFVLRSAPYYDAGSLQWQFRLERSHEERARNGDPE